LEKGLGVERNVDEAVKDHQMAMDQRNAIAEPMYGVCAMRRAFMKTGNSQESTS
jgi:TPR repeat protein